MTHIDETRRVGIQANAVTGFLPSVHGLHFANRWAPGPTIRLGPLDPRWLGVGDAASGLCGGMAWFVRERFAARRPIPPDTQSPDNGTLLFRAIVRRQIISLDWLRVPLRYWLAAAGPEARLASRSRTVAWPRVRAAIDEGRLPMVGLVRHHGRSPFQLDRDHQVLAFAYAIERTAPDDGFDPATVREVVTLRLYDPNWPDRDDVTVTFGPTGMAQSTGERLVGLLALD